MELQKRIEIILQSEKNSYSQNGRIRGGLGSFNIGLQSVPNGGWTNEGSVKQYLFDTSDQDFIKSENAQILLKLYSSLNKEKRVEFELILLTYITKENEYRDVGYLICFIFIRLGKIISVVTKAVKDLRGDDNNAYSNLLHLVNLVIAREYNYFSFSTLTDLSELLKDDKEAEFAVLATLREASKHKMSSELEDGENTEIAEDMVFLTQFFQTNFVDEDVSNLIKHIQDLFEKSEFDSVTHATCIDRVRVFISTVTKIVAIEKSKATKKILENGKDDKIYSKYLRDNNIITAEELGLLVAFYSLCSNNGSHISRATMETARLVKNMGFEIAILLLSYLKND